MFQKILIIAILLLQSILFFQCAKNNTGEEGHHMGFSYKSCFAINNKTILFDCADSIKDVSSVYSIYKFNDGRQETNRLVLSLALGNFSQENMPYSLSDFHLEDANGKIYSYDVHDLPDYSFTLKKSEWINLTMSFNIDPGTDISKLKLLYDKYVDPEKGTPSTAYTIGLKPRTSNFIKDSFFAMKPLDRIRLLGKNRLDVINDYGFPDKINFDEKQNLVYSYILDKNRVQIIFNNNKVSSIGKSIFFSSLDAVKKSYDDLVLFYASNNCKIEPFSKGAVNIDPKDESGNSIFSKNQSGMVMWYIQNEGYELSDVAVTL